MYLKLRRQTIEIISHLTEYETFYVTDRSADNVTTVVRSVHRSPAHMHEDGHVTRQLLS